jgi:3-oxoacyl-[acyl-carrier-protein] synthase-3
MSARVRVSLAGTGAYAPARVLSNADFEKLLDTSDEWIVQRTGIRERRVAAEGQATADMCVEAATRALQAAAVEPESIDLVVVGTLTPDFLLPACSCLVQTRLGCTRAGAFDVAAACTGFLTALHTAEAFIAAGRARRVLAIGAETLSRFVDMKDRSSCILFGDGAGAAVLTPFEERPHGEILRTTLGADGTGFDLIHMRGGGSMVPPTHESIDRGDHYIRLKGRDVFRFAVSKMSDLISEMAGGHAYEEIGLIVPHQVNSRIIEAAMERVGWPLDKVVINIDRYGNTSAASVPMALDEAVRAGRIQRGKLLISVAFGAGLTWGGTLIRW